MPILKSPSLSKVIFLWHSKKTGISSSLVRQKIVILLGQRWRLLSLRPDKTPATPEGVSCKNSDLATHSGSMFPSWFSGFWTDFADGVSPYSNWYMVGKLNFRAPPLSKKTELFVTSSYSTEPLERQKSFPTKNPWYYIYISSIPSQCSKVIRICTTLVFWTTCF